MNVHKIRINKVKECLALGDEDLDMANSILNDSKKPSYRIIAFHAQQCAEKYLKAYLVFHKVDFPYTHNIEKLLDLSNEKAAMMTEEIEDAVILTDYSITTRYPGLKKVVTKDEAENAVRIAEKVRDTVRKTLKQAGLKL